MGNEQIKEKVSRCVAVLLIAELPRLSKKSAGRKSAFARKGIGKTLANKKERFFETHAFAVCVNRPLTCKLWRER